MTKTKLASFREYVAYWLETEPDREGPTRLIIKNIKTKAEWVYNAEIVENEIMPALTQFLENYVKANEWRAKLYEALQNYNPVDVD